MKEEKGKRKRKKNKRTKKKNKEKEKKKRKEKREKKKEKKEKGRGKKRLCRCLLVAWHAMEIFTMLFIFHLYAISTPNKSFVLFKKKGNY